MALGAGAAAAPVYPASGQILKTTKPTFTWTIPQDENTLTASVASAPTIGPTGEFLIKNIIALDQLQAWSMKWVPQRPLFAGNYWWHVASRNPDLPPPGFQWSAVVPFRVAQTVSIRSLAVKSYPGSHSMMVTVKWNTSVRNMTLNERVLKDGRQVFSKRTAITNSDVLGEDVAALTLPSSLAQGSSIKLIASLTAGKAKASKSHALRSP